MVENVIQIKSGILMRVQKTSYMRKRLGIPLHAAVKMVNI